tara:strand:+ start:1130 stop:1648 length:519 start_codon:yes stop_codon:yes gene_type:complete
MTTATITITNSLPTDTGFALRQDDGSLAQVFVPSHIMRGAGMSVGNTYDVVLIENSEHLRGTTPWRVTQMDVGPDVGQQPAPEKTAKAAPVTPASALIDDRIMEQLSGSLWMTTGELTTALGANGTIVRDRLLAMFNRGEIVRADVHARPNLQRATMCLWAIDIDAFIADGE